MAKKRLLIIGTAQQSYISDYLTKVDFASTEVHLLVPKRDMNVYDLNRVTYFNGTFHPFFPPLFKTMLSFRPDEIVVVCGMTYDHDNVIRAVSFYSCFSKLNILISVRNEDSPADKSLTPSPAKEILKWLGLGSIALIIKAVAPFKRLRVGEIYSSRLGHLAMECEVYLSECDTGRYAGCFDLFYFKDGKVANKTLAEMYCHKMRVSPLYSHILDAIRRFNLTSEHEVILNTRTVASVRDAECVMQQTYNHIEFDDTQTKKGFEGIKKLGLNPEKPHVCIFGRDSVFLKGAMPQYNDADMQEVRDMHIQTFSSCAEELLRMGYNVLRMGSAVKDPLQVNHPNFIDYSVSGKRTEFMDVYLSSKCRFFVGVQSGLMHIPMVFRIPCLSVNVVRLEIIHFCSPEDLAVFKLLWSKSEKRFLTVSEQIESGISRWRVERFANSDIEVIDNTEDEILEATKEMHARVEGTWQISEYDLELQKNSIHNSPPPTLIANLSLPSAHTFCASMKKSFSKKREHDEFSNSYSTGSIPRLEWCTGLVHE